MENSTPCCQRFGFRLFDDFFHRFRDGNGFFGELCLDVRHLFADAGNLGLDTPVCLVEILDLAL